MIYVYEYFISFILSFIIAFSATPVAKKLAFKIGAVDVPKDNRRMHKKPIALFGGAAIVAGFVFTLLINMVGFFNMDVPIMDEGNLFRPDKQLLGFLAGIAVIVACGIIDDIFKLKARYKFMFQILAALIVVSSGTVIQNITNPFAHFGMSDLRAYPYITYPVTMLWIVGITNAINFIDGLDGLAAGVSSIASLSLFFVSLITGDMYSAMITAILAGSILGFLPYNFNPAKLFMGETGSAFLGFSLGVISIQGTLKSYTAIAIAIPILVLGLPLFDTLFAILRRLLKGRSIAEADREHLHHRLIDMGLSHKQSVVVMYIVSAALGLFAIVLADKGTLSAIILVIAVSVFVVGGARYMSEISSDGSSEDVQGDSTPENTEDKGEDNNEAGEADGEKPPEEPPKKDDISTEML